jgi:hypothetical protein
MVEGERGKADQGDAVVRQLSRISGDVAIGRRGAVLDGAVAGLASRPIHRNPMKPYIGNKHIGHLAAATSPVEGPSPWARRVGSAKRNINI